MKYVLDNFQSTSAIQEIKHFTDSHLTPTKAEELVTRLVFIIFLCNQKWKGGTNKESGGGQLIDVMTTGCSRLGSIKRKSKQIKRLIFKKNIHCCFLANSCIQEHLAIKTLINKLSPQIHRNAAADFKDLVDSFGDKQFFNVTICISMTPLT